MTIETFQTAGHITDPQPPTWVAVIRDGQKMLHTSSKCGSEQAAIADVERQYAGG